jgi:uncharacterized protein YcnI
VNRIKLVVAVALVALVVLTASPASAHVTVQPPEATAGGFAKLTFRVPNERPDSGTVGLRVSLPTDHPIANVSVKPKQGWTAAVVPTTLSTPIEVHGEPVTEVVSEVSWSGGEIKPGEFDEFEISVGPLPEGVDELYFPAIQVYASGEEVSWIQVPEAGSDEELDRPAPKLTLEPAEEDGHGGGASAEAASADGSETASASSDAAGSDSDDALAIAALVIALAALVLAIGGIVVARGSKASDTS